MVQEGMIRVVYQMKADICYQSYDLGVYHLQGEEDHEARHGGALRRDISSIFWNVTGEYPVSRGRVAWRFGDRNKSYPSVLLENCSKSKSKLMKLLRLLIIQRLHGVSESSGGSVLPLTSLVEIIYRG